ncbi:MAG: hypothetical protein ACQEWM_12690 [Actinomycetota bacterium]
MSAGTSLEDGTRSARARLGGVALTVVSALVGVAAAAFVVRPPWGVPAAIVLAVATVGVAFGLLLQRRREADRDRPVPRHDGLVALTAERARRSALVCGAFLLAVSAAAALSLALPGSAATLSPAHAWSLIVVFGGCGIALLVLGLARDPRAVTSSERPDTEPTVDTAGWMRLGAPGTALDARSITASLIPFQLMQVPLLLVMLGPAALDLGPWAVIAVIGAVVVAFAILGVVLARRRRPAWIAQDGSALRHGSRTVPAAEVEWASLSSTPLVTDATARTLALSLGRRRGMRATVHLRRRGRLVLSERETAALLALVERSSIALPHDAHDPTGRFSKSFHPNHLTKHETLAVVEHPPGDGEPLPIGAG